MAEAAAASGQQGTLEGCATRRKTEKHAAAAGLFKGEKAAGATEAAAVREDDDSPSGLDYVVAHKRLSQEEIDFILSQKRKHYASPEEFEAEWGEEEFFAEFEEDQDNYFEFQRWVRSEYEAHGFVGVDDDYIAERVKREALMDEEWAEMISEFVFSDDEDENTKEKP